jgi:hypothetical protein
LFVLVEEFGHGGDYMREVVTPMAPAQTMDEARAIAEQICWTYRPRYPRREQSRSVFECPDGSWVVNIEGYLSRYHFKVIVARWHGDRAAK